MDVDETLSRYSDLCYGTALTVYVLAMIMFLAALASKRQVVEKADQLVGAGGPTPVTAGDVRTPGKLESSGKAPLGDRLAKMAYGVVLLATVLQIGSIVLRGFATGRAPWGNMYEFVSIACAAGMVAALVVLRKREYRPLLGFVLLPVVVLLFIAGTYLYTNAAPVVPALKSYWLAIHVSIVAVGSGVFLVSGVASILYLLKLKYPNPSDKFWGRVLQRVPSAQTLDRLAYKTVVFAFPLFGLGVICGAIWAEAAWGRFWGWDPKETVSFIAWVIYAAYLHARATAGWRNTAAAWINIAGFVAMLFNLFIINLVVSGLHSYAGL
ncbi:MAG: c-type cytochrome biogenesis protein CcsB [Gordonia sp.]|uniref:C-type cytochrome biogenesis protein CcsB n=1 Tax=Gordonia rubripertincta TaxID=36822 RepID=A0ABT4MY16_GORRU|nr:MULTISPECIES: c-type cytochrome biogenesis protein CcsB [Mycobacteriales]MBA4023207.1 c-type cytochrome biogenesis protein CcsB [Gordonia sp. (in: high G+C Gram-positive bacteria)]MCZ4551897.1 c-type cytochrome biogenesis protein CcsB [Gordonia rubripertincta]OZG28197.1 c-type cytochrome biogenesis protein CcsB [Williamsia sp. 1138]